MVAIGFILNCKMKFEYLGIMTQCVRYAEIPSEEWSFNSYCENLIRKINFKNGGINTIVDLNDALKNRKVQDDSYMFFGAVLVPWTNVIQEQSSVAGFEV